jgi:hypothetical protein
MRALLWLFAVIFLTMASLSFAAAKARVVLIADGDPALGRKVRAEAAAAGLVIVEASRESVGASDAELLERNDASALIQLMSADRARVYAGRQEDGPSSRTLIRRPADGESFAVRVVEEVYARLVELKLVVPEPAAAPDSPRASEPENRTAAPQGPPSAEAAPEPAPLPMSPGGNPPAELDRKSGRAGGEPGPRLWLSAGLAGTQAAGGMGPTGHAALGLRLEPAPRFGLAAHALLPVTENSFDGPEGSADASVNLFLAELGYTLFEPADTWSVQAGIGAGVAVLTMQGEAAQPLSGQSDRLTSGLYFAHGGFTWSVASWLRVTGMLFGGMSAPRPVARFSEREVATWGRAFAGAMVSSEFGLALSQTGKP